MSRALRCGVVALIALGVAACTSTHGGAGYATAPTQHQPAQKLFKHDAAYIAQVERTARMRGVDLHWVNPPVKRNDGRGGSESQ